MADSIQSVNRAFGILSILSEAASVLSLADLAMLCNLPKSTAHRLVNSLVQEGYVEALPRGYYALSHKFLCLSARSIRNGILWHIGLMPRQLRDLSGHTTYIGMLRGADIVYLHKVAADTAPVDGVGHSCPANCSAIGKAILAAMPWPQVQQIFAEKGLERRTQHSITDLDALREELDLTRRRGYALSNEECTLGVLSMAAPVFDGMKNCVCALSLDKIKTGNESDMPQYVPHLFQKASEISERMGLLSFNEASPNPYVHSSQALA